MRLIDFEWFRQVGRECAGAIALLSHDGKFGVALFWCDYSEPNGSYAGSFTAQSVPFWMTVVCVPRNFNQSQFCETVAVERYRPLAVGVKGLVPCFGVQRDEESLCKKGGGDFQKATFLVADHRRLR